MIDSQTRLGFSGSEGGRNFVWRSASSAALVLLLLVTIGGPAWAAARNFTGGGCTVLVLAEENWGEPHSRISDENGGCGQLRLYMRYLDPNGCQTYDSGYLNTNGYGHLIGWYPWYNPDNRKARGYFKGAGTTWSTGWVVHVAGC